MTDTDVHPINARYIELAARFKACWTFHRFQEGLQKFFGLQDLGPVPIEFQSLYKQLKGASAALDSAEPGPPAVLLQASLEGIAKTLGEALVLLDERDEEIAPSLVRRFFSKVDSYDERILIEMVRFYQEVQRGRSWSNDRIDKVDFLVSALARRIAGPDLSGDRRQLERVLDGLASNVNGGRADEGKARNRLQMIERVREGVDAIGSFAELEERNLIDQYRTLKHSLGDAFFERSLLGQIVETNVAVGRLVVRVTRWEEERIFADFERLSDIESSTLEDRDLLDAVTQVRADVGTFKKKIETGSVRVAEVIRLRNSLGSISSSLEAREGRAEGEEAESGDAAEPAAPVDSVAEITPAAGSPADGDLAQSARSHQILRGRGDDLLAPWVEALLGALGAVDREVAADEAIHTPEMAPLGVDPREVIAYRRLAVGGGAVDRERFLLAAAALRGALERAEGDDRSGVSSPPAGVRARLLETADRFLRESSHYVEQAGRESPVEAESLLRCRMRLMRAFSSLWLVEQERHEARSAQRSAP